MKEEPNPEHVLTLQDIEHERDVALRASLSGAINYVRMARQIESAVVGKFLRADAPIDTLIGVIEAVVKKIPLPEWERVGIVKKTAVADHEIAAFVACAEWFGTVADRPDESDVLAEARRRYGPKPTLPERTVTLSTGTWRKTDLGWQCRKLYTGIMRTPAEWKYNLSMPTCSTADDYAKVAAYLAEKQS